MRNLEQTQWDTGETCEGCGSPIIVGEASGLVSIECDCGRAEAA